MWFGLVDYLNLISQKCDEKENVERDVCEETAKCAY